MGNSDNRLGAGKGRPPAGGVVRGAAAAAAIRVTGSSSAEWSTPGIFKQNLLVHAVAILVLGSLISGILSIFWEHRVIREEVKDLLGGVFYFLAFGGALLLSGRLSAKKAAVLFINTILFMSWNYLFLNSSSIVLFVVVIGLWLPFYWVFVDHEAMCGLGIGRNGILRNFLVGLALALALTVYVAWGMINFGFTISFNPWPIMVNTAQVLPMYLMIFSLLFMVWNRLRAWGISQMGLLLALTILSVALNVPSLVCVCAATGISLGTSLAGFFLISVLIVFSAHFTFGKLGSAIPAACIFTFMSALLLMAGLT